jgi:exopolysaccharide production protein ExoQ
VIGLVNMQMIVLTNGEIFAWLRRLDFAQGLFGPPAPVTLVTFDTQMSLISLLIWPVVGVVRRRYGLLWAVAIAVAAFIVTLQGLSGTAKLACMVGFAALIFAWLLPRWSAAVVGAVLALWIALAPVLYQSQVMQWGSDVAAHVSSRIGNSMLHRRAIWEFSVERIRERPLLGWGLGNSRIMPGSHETAKEGSLATIGGLELMPLHPHNAALQLWLELGLPGVLLGIAFVACMARAIGRLRSHPVEQGLMVALVAAITVNAASGYNLWHTWWMTFIWLAAVFTIAALPSEPATRSLKTPAPTAV